MEVDKKSLDCLPGLGFQDIDEIFIRATSESFEGDGFEARSTVSVFGRSWI
jgi:hypothetical protein